MPRPLSVTWQYFELLTSEQGGSKKARCSFCGLEKAASITRLHQHLLYRCSQITPNVRDQLRNQKDNGERESSKSSEPASHDGMGMHRESRSPPLPSSVYSSHHELSLPPRQETSAFSHFGAEQHRSQAMLDWYLARAFFSAGIPFETIENPHMITFLKHLQPNYKAPKGHRLQQYLLKEQHWDLIKRDEHENIQRPFANSFPTRPIIPESSLSTNSSIEEDLEGNL